MLPRTTRNCTETRYVAGKEEMRESGTDKERREEERREEERRVEKRRKEERKEERRREE